MAGRRAPIDAPDTLYSSRNSRYRVVEGRVDEASDESVVGAELVGWLLEDRGATVVDTWAFRARGVFVVRAMKDVIVTSRILARAPGGEKRSDGDKPASIPPAPPVPLLKGGAAPGADGDDVVTNIATKAVMRPTKPMPPIPRPARTPRLSAPELVDDDSSDDTPPRR